MARELKNEKHRLFCEIYLANGFNARNAYFEAFPEADKTNKGPSYPYTLLKREDIQEYIKERRQEIYEAYNIDAMRIAQALADIAFSDKRDEIYATNFKLKALELLQKQLGLQNTKIESKNEVIEVRIEEEENKNETD